jgi:hypothetical protein
MFWVYGEVASSTDQTDMLVNVRHTDIPTVDSPIGDVNLYTKWFIAIRLVGLSLDKLIPAAISKSSFSGLRLGRIGVVETLRA